jgi:hypothetical protein
LAAAVSARATTYDFSYIFDDDGSGVVSGAIEGTNLGAGPISVSSIDSLRVFGEAITPPFVTFDFFAATMPGTVTFDGSNMDLVATDSSGLKGVYVFTEDCPASLPQTRRFWTQRPLTRLPGR